MKSIIELGRKAWKKSESIEDWMSGNSSQERMIAAWLSGYEIKINEM